MSKSDLRMSYPYYVDHSNSVIVQILSRIRTGRTGLIFMCHAMNSLYNYACGWTCHDNGESKKVKLLTDMLSGPQTNFVTRFPALGR